MKELTNLESLNNKKLLVVLPVNKVVNKNINQVLFSLREQKYKIDLLILTSNTLTDEEKLDLKTALVESKVETTRQDKEGKLETVVLPSNKDVNYLIESTDSTTFQQIFNEAFNYASVNGYEWFSVVEYLDAVDKNWYQNFAEFSEAKTGMDVFVPITKQTNNGFFSGFINEACWAEGFAEEAGLFDIQMLLRLNCINLPGAVLKVESLKKYSAEKDGLYYPIKETFKVTSIYEFFLRFIYNDLKVFAIPRIGYEFAVLNATNEYDAFLSKIPSNLLDISPDKGGVSRKEYQFWIESARKEYFFDEDRSIEYKETV